MLAMATYVPASMPLLIFAVSPAANARGLHSAAFQGALLHAVEQLIEGDSERVAGINLVGQSRHCG
jgi:hypothetical protein